MAVGTKNIPQCQWESIIPPPFLEQWKAFLGLLGSHNFQGSDVDAIVLPLVPMFHTEAYNLPFRILKEQEVIQLSGLQDLEQCQPIGCGIGPGNIAPKRVWQLLPS